MSHVARASASRLISLLVVALVAACGQSQQGGFHGFPPAEVTTIKLEPKTLPATYEYVGQTQGSKEVEVRARVTGILERKMFQEGAPVRAAGPRARRARARVRAWRTSQTPADPFTLPPGAGSGTGQPRALAGSVCFPNGQHTRP